MVDSAVTIIVVIIFVMMLLMLVVYAVGYHTIGPNKAMVLFRGSGKKDGSPHAIIQGGGKFIIPGGESISVLDMEANLVEFDLSGVPTASEGYTVTLRLRVVAIWKIIGERGFLEISAGKLMDRTRGENEMAVKEQLEKAIRNFSAGITPEAFEADMELVRAKAQMHANVALVDQGLQVLTLHFLKIRPQG